MAEYHQEVISTSKKFYTWFTLHDLIVDDQEVYQFINNGPNPWMLFMDSLQTAFQVGLGRIFDQDKNSFSIHTFLSQCVGQIDEFSKNALENRRMASSNGVRPDYLDDLLLRAIQPTELTFLPLQEKAAEWHEIYRLNYSQARNKAIAHNDLKTMRNKGDLYATTNIRELSGLFLFLFQVDQTVLALYHDGRLIDYANIKSDLHHETANEVRRMFNKILGIQPQR